MRGKILVMLLLAVVCGGASLVMARAWLDGQASARLKAIEATIVAPKSDFATLVVAAEPLRFGAPLDRGNLKTIPWPEDALPEGAFASIDDLVAAEPRSVLFPLEANEPVLAAKITGPGERPGLSRLISEGHRAVTVRVNDVLGVAGFILPGDRVDVVLTVDRDKDYTTDVILQNIRVLTIDQTADQRTAEPVVVKAVTLEVDPAGAQKISLAQNMGVLSLSLRPSGDTSPAEVATVTPADITSLWRETSVAEVVAVPVAPAPVPVPVAAAEPPKPRNMAVTVVRSAVETEYRVPMSAPAALAAASPAPAAAAAEVASLVPVVPSSIAILPPPAPVAVLPPPAPGRFAEPAAVEAAMPRRRAPVLATAVPVAPVRQDVAALEAEAETGATRRLPAGGHIIDLPSE